MTESRWLRRLYAALAVVTIVPIWSVRYLPTVDGPSHVYNSWVLYQLLRGTRGPIAQWFRIDWRPHPNWIGHAVMSMLMFVFSPIVAEKLLVTGIVLLFLYAMWRYAGLAADDNKIFAFLAVPFAYHLLLQCGFYNFSAGAALYFLIVAVWWCRRDRPDARTIAIVAALLVVCYFSHAMAVVLSMLSIGLLWLLTLRGRRLAVHARHFIAFIPVIPLLLWFRSVGAAYLGGAKKRGELLRYMARLRVLYTFDERQLVYTTAIAVLLAALIVATLVRRQWKWRESDALIVLSVLIVFLYILSAQAVSDVQDRMGLFVALTPLAWLDLRLPRRAAAATAIALAVLAVAYDGYIIQRYRRAGGYMQRFVRSANAVGEHTTFMPILYEIAPPHTFVPIYSHAADYVATKKESVDITNYEPVLGYFPIALRPDVEMGNFFATIGNPWQLDFSSYVARAQYIFTWRGDADGSLPGKLAANYVRVGGSDSGVVYRSTGTIDDPLHILLPLLGTTVDHGAPGGMIWRVEQSARNTGRAPVMLLLSVCDPVPCRIDLLPGQSAPIAVNAPYGYALLAKPDAKSLEIKTVLRRVDLPGSASVTIPAVSEEEFREGKAEIEGVPFSDPYRVTLRVWTRRERPQSVTVTLRDAAGGAIASKQIALDGHGAGTIVDVVHDFGNVPQRREPVRVEIDADGAQVWGFVSAIDPNVPLPALYFPR